MVPTGKVNSSADSLASFAWLLTFTLISAYQTAMKTQLRKGGPNALNVYSVGFVSGSGAGLLGYATFPWIYSGGSKDDGVVILYSSVPGGTCEPYNEGRSLTHETG